MLIGPHRSCSPGRADNASLWPRPHWTAVSTEPRSYSKSRQCDNVLARPRAHHSRALRSRRICRVPRTSMCTCAHRSRKQHSDCPHLAVSALMFTPNLPVCIVAVTRWGTMQQCRLSASPDAVVRACGCVHVRRGRSPPRGQGHTAASRVAGPIHAVTSAASTLAITQAAWQGACAACDGGARSQACSQTARDRSQGTFLRSTHTLSHGTTR